MTNHHIYFHCLAQNVVPAVGALLFIIMAASPTRAVWRTRRRSDIGGAAAARARVVENWGRLRLRMRHLLMQRTMPLGMMATSACLNFHCPRCCAEFNPLPTVVLVANAVCWNIL